MKELEIEWHTSGFVKDAKYSFHLPNILDNYKNEFKGADKLIVNINEIPIGVVSFQTKHKSVIISEDRKVITINQNVHKYCDTKGKVTSIPEPIEVFDSLRFLLNKATEEYKNDFNI